MRFRCLAWASIAAAWSLPVGLDAQTPTRQDSILIQLQRMQQRLDSLERVIAGLRAAGRDTTTAGDELSRLRAAAQAAAREAQPDQPDPATQQSRTGNLQVLNPEVSVTGDAVGTLRRVSGESATATAVPREFEFSFQSALDPYTRTKVFVTKHEDFEIAGFEPPGHAEEPDPADPVAPEGEVHEESGFEIEEGYLYWVGLPGNLGLKVGHFRQEIGLYNRWHTHALLEVERPLAAQQFLGEEGLVQTGMSVTLPHFDFGPATQTVTLEATRGNNELLFEDGVAISYLGRLQNFWDLGHNAYLQFGATGVYGSNDELTSRLIGVDGSFRWAPAGQALYKEFQLKSEWYFGRLEETTVTETGNGGYVQANYRANRRLVLGARYDYVDGYGDDPPLHGLVPSISWWQSEWVRLRLQYNLIRRQGVDTNHTVLVQVVWAMGPHKHETY